jgi:hypothetical protein
MARKDSTGSKELEAHFTTPVVVRGYSESGELFSELTDTMTVNANGCLIVLRAPVRNEQLLLLINVKTKEEILCHVVTRANSENGLPRVKLGFVNPSRRFWRLKFSDEDRNPAGEGRSMSEIGDTS